MRNSLVLAGFVAVGLLGINPTPALSQDALGGGASFPNAVYQKWIEMAKAQIGITIQYSSAGEAGAGQSKVLAREIDFAVSGLPMPASMRSAGNLLQFPVVIGAVVPVFNIPGVASGQLRLNGALLAKIFAGGIKRWNDPAIVAINPGISLPDLEIRPVSIRDAGAGASFGFTQYILAADAEWRDKHGTIVTRRWAVGSNVEDASAMVETVKGLSGSIGYMPYGLAMRTKQPLVALSNPAGKFLVPTLSGIAAAAANADWNGATDLVMTLVNQPGEESWPIAQTSYAQIPLDPQDPARSKAVRRFFDFAYGQGGSILADLGFVPLSPDVQNRARALWTKVGS